LKRKERYVLKAKDERDEHAKKEARDDPKRG
jgi:hypothetical protein